MHIFYNIFVFDRVQCYYLQQKIFETKVLFHSSLTMKQYYDQFNEID